MAYNKAREEKKWKQWKENEEQQLRILLLKMMSVVHCSTLQSSIKSLP